MNHKVLKVVTRGSLLARKQTKDVSNAIATSWPGTVCEELVVVTKGCEISESQYLNDNKISMVENPNFKGLFTAELENALDEKRAHFAVHCLKDLPAQMDSRYTLAAIPRRLHPADALIGIQFKTLIDSEVTVGTSSLRRINQLKFKWPKVKTVPIRGNIDTRLRKLDCGECDALVLAVAGLHRLGIAGRISHVFASSDFIPAGGQGALALQCRSDDTDTIKILQVLDDKDTRACVTAERTCLQGLNTSCSTPIGVFGQIVNIESGIPMISLKVWCSDPSGKNYLTDEISGPTTAPEELGQRMVDRLSAKGIRNLLNKKN